MYIALVLQMTHSCAFCAGKRKTNEIERRKKTVTNRNDFRCSSNRISGFAKVVLCVVLEMECTSDIRIARD